MTPSNAELREAILWAIKSQFEGLDCSHLGHKDEEAARLPNQALENATDELAALFQAREQQAYERGLQTGHDAEAEYQTRTNLPKREQQLLTELLGELNNHALANTVDKNNHAWRVEDVVSVIEAKRKELQ